MGFLANMGLRAAAPAKQVKSTVAESTTVAFSRDIADVITDAGDWLTDTVTVDDLLSFDLER